MSRKTVHNKTSGLRNRFRIISGKWRGRRLSFPSVPGVRPTPDRVRETLFNWLGPDIRGARCLDLFAGSGALGLEALSRGAATTTFVEQSRTVASGIGANLELLDARGTVLCEDAFDFLADNTDTFDLVFLDPPFDQQLAAGVFRELIEHGTLRPGGRVYLEALPHELATAVPGGWRLRRQGRAGKVAFGLAVQETNNQQDGGV